MSTTAQAIRGGWSQSRNIHPRMFVNLFNDWEYDKFQNLDLRFVLGGGSATASQRRSGRGSTWWGRGLHL